MQNSKWWQTGVIYQIYPRSYYDTNGDGIGDLRGITEKLDYLAWLGVDGVWISPFFVSLMEDFGYDVVDYCDVDPIFGTLEDFDRLIEKANSLDLKIILDLVPNHTSHEHPWFKESRSSRDNPKRDWYIWRDAKPNGDPPNNWRNMTTGTKDGSAWEWDETTEQYYLASFAAIQPDLNWRNPDVQTAINDVIRFWLERGASGFRIDMIDFLAKDPQFRDEETSSDPKHDYVANAKYHINQPETKAYVRAMKEILMDFPNALTIGEVGYHLSSQQLRDWSVGVLDIAFNFKLIHSPFEAVAIRSMVDDYDATIDTDGQPSYVIGNHDMPRPIKYGERQARLAAMLVLTLRGTPFIYYGDEIGMENVDVPLERRQDPHVVYETGKTRDECRTPMQWNSEDFAGFSSVEPWLPIGEHYSAINVEAAQNDPYSLLMLHRALIQLRKESHALQSGDYKPMDGTPSDCFAFYRTAGNQKVLVVLNFSGEKQSVDLSLADQNFEIKVSTQLNRKGQLESVTELQPYEGIVAVQIG